MELFAREAIHGDLMRARPSHPLAALITEILRTSLGKHPEERTLTFPSGNRYHVEPSRRSERAGARWLMLLISVADSHHQAREETQIAAEWGFTPRERELVVLLLRGTPTEEIRRALDIAQNTLKTHIKGLLQKTGTRTRAQLVAKLLRKG